VEIHVLQGERKMAGDNKSIGRFHLDGIPPAPRGMPQIEVTFDIDANGILHVSAKDLGTGKEQKITITASSGLNEEEVKKMVSEAAKHSSEDQKRREAAETRNTADNAVYQTERLLKEQGDKLDAAKKAKAESAVEDLKQALKAGDTDAMKAKMEALNAEMQALSADLYARAKTGGRGRSGDEGGGPRGKRGEPTQEGGAQKDEGDVIDADFEMVNDKDGKRK
jgi:molecular chaperone DnaK